MLEFSMLSTLVFKPFHKASGDLIYYMYLWLNVLIFEYFNSLYMGFVNCRHTKNSPIGTGKKN